MEDKIIIGKMTYIEMINDEIDRVLTYNNRDFDVEIFKGTLDKRIRTFIYDINYMSENTDKRFKYKTIEFLTVKKEVVIVLWNFKKEFPIFIVGRKKFKLRSFLDENNCLDVDPVPYEINEYLTNWNKTYEAGAIELPFNKKRNQSYKIKKAPEDA